MLLFTCLSEKPRKWDSWVCSSSLCPNQTPGCGSIINTDFVKTEVNEGMFEQSPHPPPPPRPPPHLFLEARTLPCLYWPSYIGFLTACYKSTTIWSRDQGGRLDSLLKVPLNSLLVTYPWIWRVTQCDKADKRSSAILGCINRRMVSRSQKIISSLHSAPGELWLILGSYWSRRASLWHLWREVSG